MRAHYYQQFDANFDLDVPGEGYGGWQTAEIEIELEHTALVVMHAWETGTREQYPGWHRAVEYIPRAAAISQTVFPPLLAAVRRSRMSLFHVVGGGNYYQHLPGYRRAVELAGPSAAPPESIQTSPELDRLRRFRSENVFVGRHNEEDVGRGFANLDFTPEARPLDSEGIAENGPQLFALCREAGVNHLVYVGFAINWCLLLSPGGMAEMSKHGLLCSTIREATTAVENRETARAECCKEIALWRVALAFGFVFDLDDFLEGLVSFPPGTSAIGDESPFSGGSRMSERSGVPVGICILPEPPKNVGRAVQYPHALREILGHAGVCYDELTLDEIEATLPSLRVLVTVGESALSDSHKTALRAWVESGGAWLSVGGVCGLEELFGVQAERPAYTSWGSGVCDLGEGYLVAKASLFGEMGEPAPLPLHFFGGLAVRPTAGETRARILNAHQQPTERVGVIDHRVGQGLCRLIAVDITGTLVRVQQGTAVTRDGIPAPDGTSPVRDGVLKSDDGAVLDWIFDRQPVPGVPGFSAFLHPIADLWRELLLHSLFSLAETTGVALPLLWLYPNNLPAIGHLSHDTDGNGPDEARRLLETLQGADVHSTWCVIEPGYAPDLMRVIPDAGHELAMHYDSMSEGRPWGEAEFTRQWEFLTALFGRERPVSNKNHYLRWEGDTEFYGWCERHDIQIDQSKGASKTGEAGFNFGTCHPFFPVSPEGAPYDVLELPTPTQDLCVFAPKALLEPLLAAALQHHGVLHLLFHPAHIFKPGVPEALLESVSMARAKGMEWWTSAEINRWERARRVVRWRDYRATTDGVTVTLETPEQLPGATVLWLLPSDAQEHANPVTRWGRRFCAVPLPDEENSVHDVTVLGCVRQDSNHG